MRSVVENHSFRTQACGQFLDVTGDVEELIQRSEVRDGMALVYSPHTTAAVIINERESGFIEDFGELLDTLVPVGRRYRHDDLERRTENLESPDEQPNGWAHCRQTLVGCTSQTVPIVDGQLLLGRWQRIFLVEFDCARDRRVFIQVLGA